MFLVFKRILVSIFILFFFSSPSIALEWIASKVTNPAMFSLDGKNWDIIEKGSVIPDTSWVYTGKHGRLVLNRGKEMILFKPNSLASISRREGQGLNTVVRQKFGDLLLDVETKSHQHLSVETPFLAAVVKGTRFNVIVDETGAALKVRRGVVQVTDPRRGERTDVKTWQSVVSASNGTIPMRAVGFGTKAPVQRVAIVEPAITPMTKTGQEVGYQASQQEVVTRVLQEQTHGLAKERNPIEKAFSALSEIFGINKSDAVKSNQKALTVGKKPVTFGVTGTNSGNSGGSNDLRPSVGGNNGVGVSVGNGNGNNGNGNGNSGGGKASDGGNDSAGASGGDGNNSSGSGNGNGNDNAGGGNALDGGNDGTGASGGSGNDNSGRGNDNSGGVSDAVGGNNGGGSTSDNDDDIIITEGAYDGRYDG